MNSYAVMRNLWDARNDKELFERIFSDYQKGLVSRKLYEIKKSKCVALELAVRKEKEEGAEAKKCMVTLQNAFKHKMTSAAYQKGLTDTPQEKN